MFVWITSCYIDWPVGWVDTISHRLPFPSLPTSIGYIQQIDTGRAGGPSFFMGRTYHEVFRMECNLTGSILSISVLFADLSTPVATPDAAMTEVLRYYSPEVHKAAFVLPVFAEKEIAIVRRRSVKK